jgi:hypothetical protein
MLDSGAQTLAAIVELLPNWTSESPLMRTVKSLHAPPKVDWLLTRKPTGRMPWMLITDVEPTTWALLPTRIEQML